MFNTHPPSMMRQLPPTSPTSPLSPPSVASAASTQSSSMFSSMFLNSRSVAAPAPLDQSGRVPTPCGAQPLFVAQIEYPDAKYSLSVHHPADDNVISKSLLEGSKKYGSISQVRKDMQRSPTDALVSIGRLCHHSLACIHQYLALVHIQPDACASDSFTSFLSCS